MTRVALFVQTGDARPTRLRVAVRSERWAAGCFHNYRGERICQRPPWFVSRDTIRKLALVERWWLVECDTDAEGRIAIAAHAAADKSHPDERDGHRDGADSSGRILASGDGAWARLTDYHLGRRGR